MDGDQPIKEVEEVKGPNTSIEPDRYPTNDDICADPARMILYKNSDFCNLLYITYDPTEQKVNSSGRNTCPLSSTTPFLAHEYGESEQIATQPVGIPVDYRKVTLSGYYIHPGGGVYPDNLPMLSNPPTTVVNSSEVNYLAFYPVWLIEDLNGYEEVVTSGQIIYHRGLNYITDEDLGCDADLFATISPISTPRFNHTELQFEFDLRDFDRAYISRHELLLLLQNSSYLGICGARVSTGNLVVQQFTQAPGYTPPPNQFEIANLQGCNENHFTYRFVGFDAVEGCNINISGKNVIGLNRSNRILNKNGGYDPAIPSETYANPCPPMWRPQ